MLLPLRDEYKAERFPVMTIALIGANVLTWLLLQGLGSDRGLAESICLYGLVPADLLGRIPLGTSYPLGEGLACVFDGASAAPNVLTSMFMHGGWLHLLGNLWFMWVFGDNVEDAMGPARFLLFYLACGLAAAVAQVATDPDSIVPMVGASGAIGGVMGAYARLYPRTRIDCLLVLIVFFTTISIPAIWLLGYWFMIQFVSGLPELAGVTGAQGGVAFWAHVGGFLAGVVLVGPMHEPRRLQRHRAAPTRSRARHRW
jgi:membrane associated rhomboid family serine protease